MAKLQEPKPQLAGSLPRNVILHVKSLLDTIQPAPNWTPQNLRNHADAKEVFGRFVEMFSPKKVEKKDESKKK